MNEKEVLTLDLDIGQAEKEIGKFSECLNDLERATAEIGKTFSKALDPLIKNLEKVDSGICAVSISVDKAVDALNKLTDRVSDLQLLKDFSASVDEVTSVGDLAGAAFESVGGVLAGAATEALIPVISKGLSSFMSTVTISPLGVAGIVAAIAAVIAAIVLLVTNWDTCKAALSQGFAAFASFTETTWRTLYETIFLPIAQFFGETIDALWENHLKGFWDNMCRAFDSIGEGITTLWKDFLEPILAWAITVLAPIINTVVAVITGGLGAVLAFVSDVVGNIVLIIGGIIEFLVSVFTGDWQGAWEGITEILDGVFGAILGVFKGVINGFILIINTFMGLMYSVVIGVWNAIFGFIEMIGGWMGYDLNLTLPTEPYQIPYLAQGAVLPANKPFLAMVGDQRHGTNIEAPLSTIQEAVALVMQDQTAAILSGVQASVGIQREILEAVLGIQIGDDVIGRRGFCVLGFDRGHGNVCCLRGGNGYARCFGDPLAGVLCGEVSGRCGFAFGARG